MGMDGQIGDLRSAITEQSRNSTKKQAVLM